MEKYLLGLIRLLITVLSPSLRDSLVGMLDELEAKAKETVNDWDDLFVAILKLLLLGKESKDDPPDKSFT